MLELAKAIQSQVSEICEYLKSTNQAEPSFGIETEESDYEGIDDTRLAALENLVQLQDMLSTSREILTQKGTQDYVSRHALDRWKIYDAIPVGETRTYDEISEITKQPAPLLRRIIRHGMAQRIFCEPEPGVIAHTRVSKLLTENINIRDYFGTVAQVTWPAATRLVDAQEKWPGTKQRDQTGYRLYKGQAMQDMLASDPLQHRRYDNAMGAWTNDRALGYKNVIDGYDWAALGNATIVDVGGGIGTASKTLAKVFPQLTFVVEDLPDVIKNAEVTEPEIKDRITFREHSFFETQPVKDADVYFIRRVMMEWPDEKAALILRELIPAMKPGARVLIQDVHVPEPGNCSLWQERRFRESDLLALSISNAGQRELGDWKKMFDMAGPELEYKGVKPVPNSNVLFIEAIRRG